MRAEMNDTRDQIRQGQLYALLSLCTNEDLAPLVKIILSRLANYLVINEAYKANPLDHIQYNKVIGDEIRLFGGNSIRNVFRGNEGPDYSKIVIDVCKKLGVPYVKGDTVKNEGNLLDIFIEQRWQSLDPAERQKLSAEATKAAASKISTTAAVGKAALRFAALRLVSGPAGWAALGVGLLDANFRVTIPCILHIAYLRRRIMGDWGESSHASHPEAEVSVSSARSNALVIVAVDGEAVLSLARIPEPSARTAWRQVEASDDGISRLNPLLSAVPSLAVTSKVANTNYMEVICNGPLVAAKTGGGSRGYSMAKNGIKEHANLFDSNTLATMVNVSALMNVASIVLSQKHLADISRKLGEIKEAIGGIRKFQNDQRRSKLTGSIRYFEQVAPAVLEGELSDRVLYQIEHHEAELIQVYEHLAEDLRAELEAVCKLKDDEWLGSGEATSAIETHQRRLGELYHELFLCVRARSCGWQLLCMFPGEEMGKTHRRQNIEKSIEELDTDGDMLRESDAQLRKKIHELSSFWNKGATINERKLTLLKANEMLLANVATCRADLQNDLRTADEMLAALRKPVPMVARIEDGRITAIGCL
jgi:uncharacterized protein YaaW (UPF0174 family)